MRSAAVFACVAIVTLAASSACSQDNPVLPGVRLPSTDGAAPPQAPIGHWQPTLRELPPDVARDEQQSDDVARGQGRTQGMQTQGMQTQRMASRAKDARGKDARGHGGGPPTLQVGTSCEAAGRGSVVLGRDKKACLSDETTAQDTLKKNWSKYSTTDKTQCVGMATTGGPASYVELLSCLEIMRDARNIHNADALESDNSAISAFRRNRK
jgi:hypothetical protein